LTERSVVVYGSPMQFNHDALDLSGVPGEPVLVGVGGSHAYGLATPESDVDYRGCFVTPTEDFWSLDKPADTYDHHDPDIALHEVEKFLGLALKANPTVLEVFWYSEWAVKTDVGQVLIDNRDLFVTSKIRDTHVGFATAQFERLKKRQGTFSSDTAKRTEKHARHLLRLILQAERALTTGEFRITVDDPDEIFAFGKLPYTRMIPLAEAVIERVRTVPSVLPDAPDRDAINHLLYLIRESCVYV
jgi:hypothetical protein